MQCKAESVLRGEGSRVGCPCGGPGQVSCRGQCQWARKRACVEEEEDDEPFMAERFWPNDRIRN